MWATKDTYACSFRPPADQQLRPCKGPVSTDSKNVTYAPSSGGGGSNRTDRLNLLAFFDPLLQPSQWTGWTRASPACCL